MDERQPATLGLRRISLLQDLSDDAIAVLARRCAWRRFEAGQTIITGESDAREVFLVVAGRVRVHICTASGRQVTFRDMGEGDVLGEIAAIDQGRRSAEVVALGPVLLAALSAADFRQLLTEHPQLALRFMRSLVHLVRKLSDTVVELSTLGVNNRIHADLLRLARQAKVADGGKGRLIDPSPKHADIASRISTTREQVTRELSALARRGLLVKQDQAMLVSDVALLERMVEEANQLS